MKPRPRPRLYPIILLASLPYYFAIFFLLSLPRISLAGSSGENDVEFECIGSYGEKIESCAQYSHYAFLNQGYTLRVLDLANPAHPVETVWMRFDAEIKSLAIKGSALYLGFGFVYGGKSIKVYDISDPTHPRLSTALTGDGESLKKGFLGHYLLTEIWVKRYCRYAVYDVSNPLQPLLRIQGERNISDAPRGDCIFATDGKSLFHAHPFGSYADDEHRVAIQDVSTSPTTLAWRLLPRYERTLFAMRNQKLIVNDSVDSTAIPLAGVNPSATVWAYTADEGLNVMQPGQPAAAGKPGRITIENTDQGLRILEKTAGVSPALRAIYGAHAGAEQVKISGERGYLVDSEGGLQLLDLTNPSHPKLLARQTVLPKPVIRAIEDNLVFLSDEETGSQIFDFSNPTAPVPRAQYSGPAGPMSIQGNRAYLAAGPEGLQILDISNPSVIRPLGHYPTAHPLTDLATSGSLVYLLAKDLLIVDATNPAKPVLLSSTPVDIQSEKYEWSEKDPLLLKKLGPALYFIQYVQEDNHTRGVICKVCDVSTPTRPRPLASQVYTDFPAGDEAADRGRAAARSSTFSSAFPDWFLCLPSNHFWANSWDAGRVDKLTIFALSDPLNPTQIFRTSAVQTSDRVALYKKTIFLADGSGGLVILRPGKPRSAKR